MCPSSAARRCSQVASRRAHVKIIGCAKVAHSPRACKDRAIRVNVKNFHQFPRFIFIIINQCLKFSHFLILIYVDIIYMKLLVLESDFRIKSYQDILCQFSLAYLNWLHCRCFLDTRGACCQNWATASNKSSLRVRLHVYVYFFGVYLHIYTYVVWLVWLCI